MTSSRDLRASGAPRAVSGGCLRPVRGVRDRPHCHRAGADRRVMLCSEPPLALVLAETGGWAVPPSCGQWAGGGGQLADQSPLACLLSFMLTSQTLGSQDPYPCHRLVTQGHCCCSCQKPLSVFECFQGQTEGFMSRPHQSLPLWSLARCQTPLNLFPHL